MTSVVTCNNLPLSTEQFTFPDGQPHISVQKPNGSIVVRARIRNPNELVELLLLNNALRSGGAKEVHLQILYLMGGRMDRAMPVDDGMYQPFTLVVVTDIIQSVKWDSISIFDPHSDVAPALLRARSISPVSEVLSSILSINSEAPEKVLVVSPDTGAAKRIEAMAPALGNPRITQCFKYRDTSTGKLSGFRLLEPDVYKDQDCLIVDDLCDGGWTFTAIAELIREVGAKSVNLYVSHGVFSKGMMLDNIDRIFTTNSYCTHSNPPKHVTIYEVA